MSSTATVKWFDAKKGYGFASPETGGEDIFIHSANIAKDADGKTLFLDDGDTIYYQDGEHKGRKTAFEITVPIGSEKKRPPRRRGRNAGKAADAESEEIGAERQSAADATEKGEGAGAPASDKPGGKGEGGGRDGNTHRRPHSGNRSRRNDKGVAGDKPKPNSTKDPKKDEAKQAARDSAKGE